MPLDRDRLVKLAVSKVGQPYRFGAKWKLSEPEARGNIDCSGFTRWAYYQCGVEIPEGSQAQYDFCVPVVSPERGDLGFFFSDGSKKSINHVGIIADDQYMVEARGKPFNEVILRPRSNWEKYDLFAGFRRPRLTT